MVGGWAIRVLYCGSDRYARRFIEAALDASSLHPVVQQEVDWRNAIDLAASSTWTLIVLDCREADPDASPNRIHAFREAAPLTALTVLARPGAATLEEILALRAGADDWLVFPLPQEEMAERCRALIRRVLRPVVAPDVKVHGELTLDESLHEVTGPKGTVTLTCTETRLLECLLRQPGKCFPTTELLSTVWNTGPALGTDQVKVGMYRLRRKLVRAGLPGSVVESHRGLGYRIALPPGHRGN